RRCTGNRTQAAWYLGGAEKLEDFKSQATLEQQHTSNSHVSPLSLLFGELNKLPTFFSLPQLTHSYLCENSGVSASAEPSARGSEAPKFIFFVESCRIACPRPMAAEYSL